MTIRQFLHQSRSFLKDLKVIMRALGYDDVANGMESGNTHEWSASIAKALDIAVDNNHRQMSELCLTFSVNE